MGSWRVWVGLGLTLLLGGCGGDLDLDAFGIPEGSREPGREACAERSPLRRALFGDLHVHTALSTDAWSNDLAARPGDAYAYAFGEAIRLPPNDAQGRGTREVRIDRPLDFAAVTDHAEFLGERLLCGDPESEVYDTRTCQAIRAITGPFDSPIVAKKWDPHSRREPEVCGPYGERCARAAESGWGEIVAAAEQWYDRGPACSRTTLIGYEYSSFRMGSNHHRNVIFRGSVVPGRPISFLEAKREWQLWEWLRETCIDTGTGCDALAIPHNSNISNGRMFAIDYPGAWGESAQAARAELRAALEPVFEVMQHKGESECRRGLSTILGSDDEWCDFEKFENATFRRHGDEPPGECWDGPFADWIWHDGPDCLSHRSYGRYALIEGLAEEARIGANPFKFGLIASTDTHNATAGSVSEGDWPGHLGIKDARAEHRVSVQAGGMGSSNSNPGGLAGVWAEENTREAIFDALRRREVFGTSGPRIEPRLFGGWDYPADLCEDPELTARADADGVPMGADLPPRSGDGAPAFAVFAQRDPGTESAPGGLLQRIQIVKGWVDDGGGLHQQVIDVAGGPNAAGVDLDTCTPHGPGADALCGVWRDPDFDPSRRAVYYARVLENPSCRFSAWQCLSLPPEGRPADCDDPSVRMAQQERAWTSPIWYAPADAE